MTNSEPPRAPELWRQNALTEEQWEEALGPADPATQGLPPANPVDPNSDDLP